VRAARERIRSMPREEAAGRLRRVAAGTPDLCRRMCLDVAVCRLEQGPAMPFAQAVHWGAFFLQGDARIRIGRET
jgi:hypothetical protein